MYVHRKEKDGAREPEAVRANGLLGYEIGSAGYDPGNKTIGSANTVRCVHTRSHTRNGRIYGSWTFQVTMNA